MRSSRLVTGLATESRQVPRLGVVVGAAIVVTALLNTAGVFSEDAIHWANWLLGFAFMAVSAAIVFGVFVRRAERKPAKAWRAGVLFALLGLLTLAAYWSGLPPIFAFAGMYLGVVAYVQGGTLVAKRAGLVSLAVGALALVLDVVLYSGDIATRL
jgi:hypothetical protein